MLSKEEKLSLRELPKVNEELDQATQFLEQLTKSKETISEERYTQLENKYNASISELKAKKETLTNQFEMKKDELKIEQTALQNQRQKVTNDLNEINQLKEQGAISDEESKLELKQQNSLIKEIDKKASQINKDIEAINFYQNAKGDVSNPDNKLKSIISFGADQIKNKSLPKLNWKLVTIIVLIIFVSLALIVNRNVGKKISTELKNELDSKISTLRTSFSHADVDFNVTYSDITVNPIISTSTISDLKFSYVETGYYSYGWNRSSYEEKFEIKCSSLKLKLKFKDVSKLMKGNPEITATRITFSDLSVFSSPADDEEEVKVNVDKFIIAYKGDLDKRLFEGDGKNFFSSNQILDIEITGGSLELGDELKDDDILISLLGLNHNSEIVEELSLNATLNNKLISIDGKVKTFGYSMNSNINIQLDLDDFDRSEFRETKITFYDLSDEIVNIIKELESESGMNYFNAKNKIIVEISGDMDDPDIVWGKDSKKMRSQQRSNSNRQALVGDLQTLGAQVMQYYRTPTSQGGAGATIGTGDAAKVAAFIGWNGTSDISDTGTFTLSVPSRNVVRIVGVGKEKGNNGTSNTQATMTVTCNASSPLSTTINN
ncbi:MAG: hypothetical protein K9N06_05325 [Candidatus Cloacimonetes bacterium]|nr:hypothetical protein [Candidatus Cloacimonadota bacterium]